MTVSATNEARLAGVTADVMAAARVEHWALRVDPALEDGAVALAELELAPMEA